MHFSISQAADKLGIHPKTIRRWEAAGKFTPQRTLDNQRRFTESDLDKLKNIKNQPLLLTAPIPTTTPGVGTSFTPGVKYFHFKYFPFIGLIIFIAILGYFYIQDSNNIAKPAIQAINLPQDVEVALPQIANFLNGRITIGSDTGDLSFLDEKGNLYLKNAALIQGGVHTSALQLVPSLQPDPQIGRQYVNKDTGNLMYFDGLEWVTLNKPATQSAGLGFDTNQDINLVLGDSTASDSATSFRINLAGPQSLFKITGGADQEILTVNDDNAYPVLISQPTKMLANFYVPKIFDSDSEGFFLDPSATDVSLSVGGDATISSTLTFSKNGEFITNSVDNYLIISGGLGIGGLTNYGFSQDYKVTAKQVQVENELIIANLKQTGNTIEALNNDGIKLYDNSGNGLFIADGGNIFVNGVGVTVPDYVFEADYPLLSPISLEEFIKIHHHLPGVASAAEIKAAGLNLSQIVLQILERVENNVLYILDINKRLAIIEQKEALTIAIPSPEPQPTLSENDLATIITEKIADLATKYETATATASAEPATQSALLTDNPSATYSAYLNIDSMNANSGFFSDYLAVLGQATMTDLKINNTLTLNSITSLDNRLSLQPSGIGQISLLAGLMTLDDTGNVVINGNLTVNGAIVATQINTPEDIPLSINIASASAMIIYNDIGEPLATFSGQTSQFNQLTIQNSGTATISAGTNNIIVSSPKLTPNSQIIVTFNSDYTPASKYWVNKNNLKKEFTVFTNYPVNNDTSLDWLIIN